MQAARKVYNHGDGVGCAIGTSAYKGLTELWQGIVCLKGEFEEWHELQCLLGSCADCGMKLLPICNNKVENLNGMLIEWWRFALEQTTSRKGKVSKKLALVYKKTFPNVLLEYMRLKLQHFVKHNFVAKWQDSQFKTCIKLFLMNVLCLLWILPRTTYSRFRMRCNLCIGIATKLVFWRIFHLGITLIWTPIMKILEY